MSEVLVLAAGDARVEIAPATGGALSAFTWRDTAVLRPTPPALIDEGNVRRHACYPLVPYSNRIANGVLAFRGIEHRLALNFGDHPHSIHGVGWQRSWSVVSREASAALLRYDHDPATGEAQRMAWPWPFVATQSFQLLPVDNARPDAGSNHPGAALRIRLAIANPGTAPFPFGLGWHPFFPRNARTVLGFSAGGVWDTDATLLPTRVVPPIGAIAFDPPRAIAGTTLDNVYTGWSGEAMLHYPDQGHAVTLRGDTASPFLVVYVPPQGEYLAIEPVSQMTDAFNRAERGERDTGTRVLPPGGAFSCTMELCVRALA